MRPRMTLDLLKQYVEPDKWYDYRSLLRLLPVSSATLIRFLARVPHLEVRRLVEGSIIHAKRPIRTYPGSAILEHAYPDTRVLEHEGGRIVPQETVSDGDTVES